MEYDVAILKSRLTVHWKEYWQEMTVCTLLFVAEKDLSYSNAKSLQHQISQSGGDHEGYVFLLQYLLPSYKYEPPKKKHGLQGQLA